MHTFVIRLAATATLFAAGLVVAATPDQPLDNNAERSVSEPQIWRVDGGEARMRFNEDFLDLFGIGIHLSSGVIDTNDPEYAIFPIISTGGLRLNAPDGSFDRFLNGGLTLRGGFELSLPDGSRIDLRDATLRPNASNGARLDFVGPDGAAWLYVDHFMYEFLQDYRTFQVRTADLRASNELAKRIGEPALADAYVGEIHLDAQVMERSREVTLRAPSGGPDFHGTGNFVADVLIENYSMSFSRCRRSDGITNGCDGAGGDDGEVVFTPSATLRNTNNANSADVPWYQKFTTSPYPYPYVGNDQHPYLVWNMYRVVDNQLEQIAASGIKHAFLTINTGCSAPYGGHILSRNCGDTYGVGNNDNARDLGPRIEVLPATGQWGRCGSVFDPNVANCGSLKVSDPNGSYGSRMVVRESQMLAAGAQFMTEAWYIVQDDINIYNTMGWRSMSPAPGGGGWTPGGTPPAMVRGPALNAWVDPAVNPGRNVELDSRTFGRARVAVKVKTLASCPAASGLTGVCYRYDYAVQNFDFASSQTSGTPPNFIVEGALGFQRFSLNVANGTSIYLPMGADFADIDIDAGNNWVGTVAPGSVSWQAPTGNTLNWGTLYRFSFVSTSSPGETAENIITLTPADTGAGAVPLTSAIVGPAGNPADVMHDGFEGP